MTGNAGMVKTNMLHGMFKLLVLFSLFIIIQNLEVIPVKHEINYYNPKYVKNPVVNIRRKGRGSPYYFSMFVEINHTWGDNITIGFETFENLRGHYVPMLIRMEFELCKFYKEPVLGKMIVEQLPKNLSTCPIPAGWYALPDMLMHLENFRTTIPFTYEAIEITGRMDLRGYITATKELIFKGSIHGRAIQKPKHKQK